jgi:ATP-dependent Clp protease ATP-binding subunit ClpA
MARLIQDKLKVGLADELLFGELTGGGLVKVDLKDGEIVFDCEPGEPEPDEDEDDPGDSGAARRKALV